jgi:hypothetical protein
MKGKCIMKPDIDYELDKEVILSDLKEIELISKFIMYDRFGLSKKKLRNRLKKAIKKIEENNTEKYLTNTGDTNYE